ncbi:MAG: TIGR00730 family Rossman fold protein [Alphaproteobacteria bacterium]|nr:TIGR00730 family Rossman fold protein [Alphaproteobacteria bacterium]
MTIENVCVYCGSSNHIDESFHKSTIKIGTLLAKNNINIIYGGGHVGLMGLLADSALAAGGKVTGIIPRHLHDREVQHDHLTELHVVENMHERKKMMADCADAFLILPGGFGTLDETFEILTWKQLGLHNKPVIIYNEGNFWSPMITLIEHLIKNGFIPKDNSGFYTAIDSLDQIIPALTAPVSPAIDPSEKWS